MYAPIDRSLSFSTVQLRIPCHQGLVVVALVPATK